VFGAVFGQCKDEVCPSFFHRRDAQDDWRLVVGSMLYEGARPDAEEMLVAGERSDRVGILITSLCHNTVTERKLYNETDNFADHAVS